MRGSTVSLGSYFGVCAVVCEWGGVDMVRGCLQLPHAHCLEATAQQEKETLGSCPYAVMQICTQTRPRSQDWVFYEQYYVLMKQQERKSFPRNEIIASLMKGPNIWLLCFMYFVM